MAVKRVAVIGAGAAGLCAVRHLKARPDLFEPVCFELNSRVGGTWIYNDKTGLDEHGIPIQSSMYKNLRTNLPKEVMAFPQFPFKKSLPSFIRHEDVLAYLESYAEHYDVYKHIKFNHMVQNVTPAMKTTPPVVSKNTEDGWKVTYCDVRKQDVSYTEEFAAIFVCNGHYAVPLSPVIDGQDKFRGRIIHSHNYRHSVDFTAQRVVCLGAAASGQDIAIDVAHSAYMVYLSHNKAPLQTFLPQNVEQHSGIQRLTEKSVIFKSGEEREIDVLLLCTGYHFHFPFLTGECQVDTTDERITPLYKHLIHIDFPTMAFVGILKTICPFPLFEMQVKFFVATLDGTFKLPSKEKMLEDTEIDFKTRQEQGLPRRYAHTMGTRQWSYNDELADLANIERIPKVVQNLYDGVHVMRVKDIANYKKINYELIDSETYKELGAET
ncbi:hypothetical protein FSP39_013045 [Pinctada imbricata]|uniref:Flavin-containing monooxygenase n=1 Tax=Pinctada imbricata TaxID=66713 RepID=A0AA89BXB1_PINIB|nr:hypothetical protein FSP39_013045 [Pinctada imbricata]